MDILRRRGFSPVALSNTCALCGKENDSISHLFIQCEVSFSIGVIFWMAVEYLGACHGPWTSYFSLGGWGCFQGAKGFFEELFLMPLFDLFGKKEIVEFSVM